MTRTGRVPGSSEQVPRHHYYHYLGSPPYRLDILATSLSLKRPVTLSD